MTVSVGADRSHSTAPTHAVTTHPVPSTPHQVINAIATPMAPNSVQLSITGGKMIRPATGMMIPSTTPARPARAR